MTVRCLSRFSAAAALVVALAASSTHAQQSGGRARVLDGSSAAKLERSVALMQNDLAGRHRDDFDVALAMIWMNRTAGSGDLNGDGNLDVDDVRQLEIDASALLTEIQRGNLVSAIEERQEPGGDFTAADYFAQLDGLGYDEILSLAGRPTQDGYLDAVRQAREQLTCREERPTFAGSASRAAKRRPTGCAPRGIGVYAATELAPAIAAMNEGRYTDARAAISSIRLGRLSPYERSYIEQISFSISEADGDLVAAREHLLNALAARGLNPVETRVVLDRIRSIDARLAGNSR